MVFLHVTLINCGRQLKPYTLIINLRKRICWSCICFTRVSTTAHFSSTYGYGLSFHWKNPTPEALIGWLNANVGYDTTYAAPSTTQKCMFCKSVKQSPSRRHARHMFFRKSPLDMSSDLKLSEVLFQSNCQRHLKKGYVAKGKEEKVLKEKKASERSDSLDRGCISQPESYRKLKINLCARHCCWQNSLELLYVNQLQN